MKHNQKHFLTWFSFLAAFLIAATSVSAQTIKDGSYRTIGYIKSDGTVQDGSYRTIGYIKNDGTVQNGSYQTIGYVKNDGTVQDGSYRTIGHSSGVKKQWAAAFFFFNFW